jgi:hypothetical protein
MDSSIPFAEALPLTVDVPSAHSRRPTRVDQQSRQLYCRNLGDLNNIRRGNAAAALALELGSRPLHAQESVLRNHLAPSANSLLKGAWKKSKQSWDGPSPPFDFSCLY